MVDEAKNSPCSGCDCRRGSGLSAKIETQKAAQAEENSEEETMTGQTVVSSRQSPMNENLWHLSLACGHSRWVSGKKPPLRSCCRWCDVKTVSTVKRIKAERGLK
jgi:hypothetical protein